MSISVKHSALRDFKIRNARSICRNLSYAYRCLGIQPMLKSLVTTTTVIVAPFFRIAGACLASSGLGSVVISPINQLGDLASTSCSSDSDAVDFDDQASKFVRLHYCTVSLCVTTA